MEYQERLNSLLKVFVKSSVILLVGIILSKIFTYAYTIIVARTFSPETYGLFSLTSIILTLMVMVFSLGLNNGISRYIPLYRGKGENEKIKSLLSFSSNVILLTSFLAGTLLFFSSKMISLNIFHNSGLIPFLQISAIFLPLFIFSGYFQAIILSYEKVGWYSFIGNVLSPLMQLLFLITFIFLGLKEYSIIFSYNIGFFVIFISALLVSNFTLKKIFEKPSINKEEKKKVSKELFSYSWPIIFSNLALYLLSGISSFLIGYFKTASDVGIYNIILLISSFLLIVPTLFLQLFLPIITKEYSNNNHELIKNLSKQIGKWIFILNLPIFVILIFFPQAVINLLFGQGYISAANSLRFLALGMLFYSIFQISENLLSMIGKSKRILFNLGIVILFNIILNWILIPSYGINGTSFATMISYILWGGLSIFTAKHFTKIIPIKSEIIKISLISIIPASILFYFRSKVTLNFLTTIIGGIFFVLIYFLIMFLTKCLDKNDLMILSAIKRKIRGI